MDKKNTVFNISLEQYNKKYRNRRHRLLKYSKKQVEDFDKQYGHYVFNNKTYNLESNRYLLKDRKWALIGDTYYEIPKPVKFTWFRNLNAAYQVSTCVLVAGVAAAAITVPIVLLNQNNSPIITLDEISAELTSEAPKSFEVGETIKKTHISVKATYSDNRIESVTDWACDIFKSDSYTFVDNDIGEKEFTIKFNEKTTKLKVAVSEASIVLNYDSGSSYYKSSEPIAIESNKKYKVKWDATEIGSISFEFLQTSGSYFDPITIIDLDTKNNLQIKGEKGSYDDWYYSQMSAAVYFDTQNVQDKFTVEFITKSGIAGGTSLYIASWVQGY